MPFTLELENYQGPFDVLLELLNRQQLEITELSLAKITDDYLDYLTDLDLKLEEMNWFLFVATKLTFDKSQAILSVKISVDEPDLTESLQQYAKLKELSKLLADSSKSPHYTRPNTKRSSAAELCNKIELASIYDSVYQHYRLIPKSKTIHSRSEQLKQIRQNFISHIQSLKSFSDQEILKSAKNRTEASLYLLVLLEMLRNGQLKPRTNQLVVLESPV